MVRGEYGAVFAVFALRLRPDKSGLRRAKSVAFFDLRSFSKGGSEGGPGTNFIEHYSCHGTSLIGAANLSPVTKFIGGTGAVLSRRSEAESGVAVQTISKAEISHGAGFKLRADVRFAHRSAAKLGVRVQEPLQSCLGCRIYQKP